MATSTITLYHAINRPFSPDKLFIIEDIGSFLSSVDNSPLILSDYQYQRIELNKTLKVQLGQAYQTPFKYDSYIYCSIKNSDTTNTAYYWIKKLEWRSESALQLELVLDVLNTFSAGVGRDYLFDKKTLIQRQHKDRWAYSLDEIITRKSVTFVTLSDWDVSKTYMTQINLALLKEWYINHNDNEIFFDTPYVSIKVYDENLKWLAKIDNVIEFSPYNNEVVIVYLESGVTKQKIIPSNSYLVFTSKPTIDPQTLTDTADFFLNPTYYFKWEEVTLCENDEIYRKIDFRSEEINPQLYGTYLTTIEDGKSDSQDWFLVYDSDNSGGNEVVDCYLVPENATVVDVSNIGFHGGVIRPDMLEEGVNYYINLGIVGGAVFDSTKFNLDNGSPLPSGASGILQINKVGDHLLVSVINITAAPEYYVISVTYSTNVLTYTLSGAIAYGTNAVNLSLQAVYASYNITTSWTSGYNWTDEDTRTLSSISDLDKSLSTILKIIRCPYLPYEFDKSTYLEIDSNWDVVNWASGNLGSVLKVKDLNTEFSRVIKPTDTSLLPAIVDNFWKPLTNNYNFDYGTRDDRLESKIFHSEFSYYKFIYDSFSWSYKYEFQNFPLMLYLTNGDPSISIDFYTTNTINSRFAFEIGATIYLTSGYTITTEQDYYKWLIVARNNEEVIYNSAYLNYIRSGFNYDVKNKDVSNTTSWLAAGASIGGTALAIASMVATQGATAPLAIAAITGTISSAITLTNAINTTAQNERSIQQKLDQLKMQTASVNGADDVDLMKRYGKNRLLLTHYEVSPEMKRMLLDLFYYYGYKDNVCEVPNTKSRCNFNYLKCEPVIIPRNKNFTVEIMNELSNCFRTGVTYIHKFNNSWDLEQESANLERFFYDDDIIHLR